MPFKDTNSADEEKWLEVILQRDLIFINHMAGNKKPEQFTFLSLKIFYFQVFHDTIHSSTYEVWSEQKHDYLICSSL